MNGPPSSDSASYEERLTMMEGWYANLLASGDGEAPLLADYEPHAELLRSLRGRILDVGGGAGLAGRFLDPSCDYTVIDPSPIWTEPDWLRFGERFRRDGPAPAFRPGPGEDLPFASASFDAVVAFWSLNHARDARLCISEMSRVLRPGGLLYVVVEDAEPSWLDIARDTLARVKRRLTGGHVIPRFPYSIPHAIRMKIGRSWPVAEDHVRISERDLLAWAPPLLKFHQRRMLSGFLALTFERR